MKPIFLLIALSAVMHGKDVTGAVRYGDDITLSIGGESILIRTKFSWGRPDFLYLDIRNQTASSWWLKLQFDFGVLCSDEPRQWTIPIDTFLDLLKDRSLMKEIVPIVGKTDGCQPEIIKASIITAESIKTRIEGKNEPVDLILELQAIKIKRDADQAALAEEERKEAAKRATAEAARRKRLAAEKKKQDAEFSKKSE
jgi:hypothetical protein